MTPSAAAAWPKVGRCFFLLALLHPCRKPPMSVKNHSGFFYVITSIGQYGGSVICIIYLKQKGPRFQSWSWLVCNDEVQCITCMKMTHILKKINDIEKRHRSIFTEVTHIPSLALGKQGYTIYLSCVIVNWLERTFTKCPFTLCLFKKNIDKIKAVLLRVTPVI